MNSIIEKITLYDFFGYLIPGAAFLSLLIFRFLQDFDSSFSEVVIEYKFFFIFILFLWSYLCGIVLSELTRIILSFVNRNFGFSKKFANEVMQFTNLELNVIGEALEKYGIVKNAEISTNMDILKYLPIMYSMVQCNDKFKRIHNYASSESMYKNLSAAVFLGGIPEVMILFADHCSGRWIIGVTWVLSFLLFIHRSWRFRVKKYSYTLVWFLDECNKKMSLSLAGSMDESAYPD